MGTNGEYTMHGEKHTRDTLTDKELRVFSKNLVDGFGRDQDKKENDTEENKEPEKNHVPESLFSRVRHAVRELFHSVTQPAAELYNIPHIFRGVKDAISSTLSKPEEYDRFRLMFQELRDQGQLLTERIHGKAVGTTGYKCIGIDADSGRNVWEIVRVSVLPEHEGNRVSSRLMTAAQESILGRDPQAIISIVSMNEKIQGWAKKRKYIPISLVTLWEMEHPTQKIPEKEKDRLEKKDETVKAYIRKEF